MGETMWMSTVCCNVESESGCDEPGGKSSGDEVPWVPAMVGEVGIGIWWRRLVLNVSTLEKDVVRAGS